MHDVLDCGWLYVGSCGAIARVSARFQRLMKGKWWPMAKRFVKICPIDFFLAHIFSFRWRALAVALRHCNLGQRLAREIDGELQA